MNGTTFCVLRKEKKQNCKIWGVEKVKGFSKKIK